MYCIHSQRKCCEVSWMPGHVSQYGESKLLLLDLCWKYARGLCPVNSQVSHLRCFPEILRLLY